MGTVWVRVNGGPRGGGGCQVSGARGGRDKEKRKGLVGLVLGKRSCEEAEELRWCERKYESTGVQTEWCEGKGRCVGQRRG